MPFAIFPVGREKPVPVVSFYHTAVKEKIHGLIVPFPFFVQGNNHGDPVFFGPITEEITVKILFRSILMAHFHSDVFQSFIPIR